MWRSVALRPVWLRYGAAVALPGIVTLLGAVVEPASGVGGRLYLLAIALVAALGGLWPALVATAISFVGLTYFYTSPHGFDLSQRNIAELAVFLVAAVVISELLARRRSAQRSAEDFAERTARLQRVTERLGATLTQEQVADAVLREALAALGAETGMVVRVVDAQRIEVVATASISPQAEAEIGELTIDSDVQLTEAVRTGEPVLLGSLVERQERYPLLRAFTPGQVGEAAACVPLVVEGHVVGAFGAGFTRKRRFTDVDLDFLRALAGQCAQALDRARLHDVGEADRGELARQKAVLEAQGEASDDGILLVSPAGGILSFNRRFVELWGIPEHVVEQRSDAQALKAVEAKVADPQRFYDRVAYLYAHPEERSQDEIELRDGRVLDRYSAPVRGEEGTYYGRVWYFRDVTEQRRREEIATFLAGASDLLYATHDYETTLRRVVRLPIPHLLGLFTVDVLDETRTLRPVAAAHADPEKERMLREIRQRYGTESRIAPVEQVLRTSEALVVGRVDEETMRPFAVDEEHLRLLLDALPAAVMLLPLVAGQRVHGLAVIGSVPGRPTLPEWKRELGREIARRIALALENARLYREAERRADAARSLEHVVDGVLLIDGELRVRFWNPPAAKILELEPGALGQPAPEVVPGWSSLADSSEPGSGDAVLRTIPVEVDGAERWLSVSRVDFDEGAVYAFRDVTEEQTLERMRSEFVSTASHQLRTPLAAVYGAARTLLRHEGDLPAERRAAFLRMIADESERLTTIVDDILLADYLTAGAVALAQEPRDAGAIAHRVVEAARAHLPDQALTLTLPQEPQFVLCDEEKLRQLLGNLLDNAIKYSPNEGEVEVAVEPADGVCRFAVRDRGLGIPPGMRDRVFEKFVRLDPELRQGVGGTGLGLYICRELVERMDGRVWVEPREGGGSAFFVELPAAPAG